MFVVRRVGTEYPPEKGRRCLLKANQRELHSLEKATHPVPSSVIADAISILVDLNPKPPRSAGTTQLIGYENV
jgi:hypothetical protein